MNIKSKNMSLSSLHRTFDKLVENKEAIEQTLVERELFGLGEKIILYDLTNPAFSMDFEGTPCFSSYHLVYHVNAILQ